MSAALVFLFLSSVFSSDICILSICQSSGSWSFGHKFYKDTMKTL